jgi:hypothetical protein
VLVTLTLYGGWSGPVAIAAEDVRLVTPEYVPSEGDSRKHLIGSKITLPNGATVTVTAEPNEVARIVNLALRGIHA